MSEASRSAAVVDGWRVVEICEGRGMCAAWCDRDGVWACGCRRLPYVGVS